MMLSVSLRWHDPDQVLGFDLSPGFLSGTPLTVTYEYTKLEGGTQGNLIFPNPLLLFEQEKEGSMVHFQDTS